MPAYKLSNLRKPSGNLPAAPANDKTLVVGGIPGVTGQGQGTIPALKMRESMISNGTVNTEGLTPTARNIATECLAGLSISVEVDVEPSFSFLVTESGKEPSSKKKKNDGKTLFPETSDPWHEHDESLSIGEETKIGLTSKFAIKIEPETLIDTIYQVNTQNRIIKNSEKLKQLRVEER